MKIIKIAGGVPAGWIEVEHVIGEQEQEAHVVAHGPGTSCKTENDRQLIQDLLEAEIGEFGGGIEILKEGHTAEYYDEVKKNKPKVVNPLLTNKPKNKLAPIDTTEQRERQFDQGYSV